MQLYLRHLRPGGVLCAWTDEGHIIPNTLAQVFPYVDQFRNENLVASNSPMEPRRLEKSRASLVDSARASKHSSCSSATESNFNSLSF